MTWTNEWLNNQDAKNIENKEYLFLIQKTKKGEFLTETIIEQVSVKDRVAPNQQKLVFK